MKIKRLLIIPLLFLITLAVANAVIYNQTYNTTAISYHLFNGSNSTIDDNTFSSKIDITAGLSDDDNSTTYLTTLGIEENVYAYWKLDEDNGTYVLDSSNNSRNGTTVNMEDADWQPCKLNNCLDFDGVNEYVNFGNIGNFERTDTFSVEFWFKSPSAATQLVVTKAENAGTNTGWAVGLLDTGEVTAYLYSNFGTGNRMQVKTTTSTFLDGAWYHIIFTYDGSSNASGTHIYVDGVDESLTTLYDTLSGSILNSINSQISGREGSNHVVAGQVDEVLIYGTEISQSDVLERYNNGSGIEMIANAYAIKPFFNHSINSSFNYWLRLKQTSSATATTNIYSYLNSTHINETNINSSLSQGWNDILINDIIYDNYNLGYRIISQSIGYISEAILIEQINDTSNPSITSCSINDTALTCNDYIRLSCNVTDDYVISSVYFQTNLSLDEASLLSTDIYFKDIQYTGFANETYSFIFANATDLAGNNNISYHYINFTYDCAVDSVSPITTLNIPNDNNITNETTINFNCSTTDNVGLANITLYHNASGSWQANETKALTGTADSEVFTKTFSYNTTLIWNCEALDLMENSDYGNSNFTLSIVEVLPDTTPTTITLLAPINNQSLFSPIDFSFNIDEDVSWCSLFIDNIFNSNNSFSAGNNLFSSVTVANESHNWYVNCSDLNFNNATSITEDFYVLDALVQDFSVTECPSTTAGSLNLWLVALIAIVVIIIGFATRIGFIGVFGSILLLVTSLYISPCLHIFGYLTAIFSLVLMIWFAVNGLGFVNKTFERG